MMSLKITIYLCFLAFLVETSHGQVCAPDNVNNTLLTTLNGRVQGSCSNVLIPYLGYYMTDVVTWFSVPYAEPPIDANRFKAPAPVQSWSSIRNGVTLPKTCLQSGQQIRLETSEDCLYLNIYATANAFKNRATSQKPILVFIHGGSFVTGSSSQFNPYEMVAIQDIIVITINYRLNALGFLHLKGEADASGNQGLLDQNMALKWIFENAATFGGDKDKITIGGQSAGAWSVGYHLFMPSSWSYFRNGILQSGGPTTINNPYSLLSSETATSRARLFFSFIGCDFATSSESLRCARNASEVAIFNGYKSLDQYMVFNQSKFETEIFLPTIDNIVFNKSIDDLASDNAFKKCNIITGFTSEESSVFLVYVYTILGLDPNKAREEIESYNFDKFYSQLQKIYKYFPFYSQLSDTTVLNSIVSQYFTPEELVNNTSISPGEYIRRLVRIFSDNQYVCQAYDIANVYSKSGQNAYVYNFNYLLPRQMWPEFLIEYFGTATHSDELVVTMGGTLSQVAANLVSDAVKRFSLDIITYWANFVKFDDPNGPPGPTPLIKWAPFLGNRTDNYEYGRTFIFNNLGFRDQIGFTENKCDFWNSKIQAQATSTTTTVTTTSTTRTTTTSRPTTTTKRNSGSINKLNSLIVSLGLVTFLVFKS